MAKSDVAELKPRLMGVSISRKEDDAFLTGRAQYLADIRLPGMLHAAILRSPHAHAKILSIDTSAARAFPGVHGAWTGDDIIKLCTGIPGSQQINGFVTTVQPLLAHQIVRYAGEALVIVVAQNRRTAEDALELIDVEYEELPVIANIDAAMAEGAPLANEGVPGNLVFRHSHSSDDLQNVFAQAAVTVEGEFHNNRVSASPMEPRGYIARHEWTTGKMTLWSATQMPALVRTMAAILLNFPEQNLEVITPHVGGGFGQKAHLHPEELLVCVLTKELGAPVAWFEDRQENLLSATHAKHQVNQMALACDANGKFLGIRARGLTDGGAYNSMPWTQLVEAHVGLRVLTGVYKVPRMQDEAIAVTTNKCSIGAYRGVGFQAPHTAREMLIEKAARKLGISPFEIRRRNVILDQDFPYTTPSGLTIREGTFLKSIDELERMVDYPRFLERQKEARKQGRYLGLGLSVFNEISGIGTRALSYLNTPTTTHDTATVRMDATGKVTVTTGLVAAGQGHWTTLAQIAADAFGVSTEDVVVCAGSTNHASSSGTWASRGAVFAAGTIGRAADIVRQRLLQLAAHLLEASVEDLVMDKGMIHVAGVPAKGMPLAQVAGAVYFAEATHPPGFEPSLEATAAFDPADVVLANGAHAAIVEVDIETGIVKVERVFAIEDCGQMINPMIVEGQIRGGVGQAIGSVLLEELVHDSNGQLLTTTFMDYLLPTSVDVPDIEIHHLCTPSALVPGGVKGMGESSMISAPAALACAVNDALAPLGVEFQRFPISPERVLSTLAIKRASGSEHAAA
ncbi:xanthine dehydrogenase family protein molybdopterin-binding subunit [Comamonas sp. Z3]|nr:xanthine dehydrogenase family protein molybdopterin-binding subunit [Comamonas sp. Z3]